MDDSRLESLVQLTRMMDAPLPEITEFALEQAVFVTASRIGYLAFANADETVLSMHAWSKSAMAECATAEQPFDYPIAATGLWGEAVRQRKPIITNDYAAPSAYKRGLPAGHVHLTRHMNVPIFDGDHIVAVAGVGNKETDYDESDLSHLTLLMDAMWLLITRHRHQDELQRHRDELEGLVAERTAQLAREIEERRRAYDAVAAEQFRLRELLALQERERRMISYEIHDGLTQHLAGTLMEIQTLEPLLQSEGHEVRSIVETCRIRLRHSLEEARNLISGLRPPSLDEFGVESAIQELTLRRETGPALMVDVISDLAGQRLDSVVEVTVFRIVQECITNAKRHSQSSRLRVQLAVHDGWLHVEAVDDGIGFDPANVREGCFGLHGICERARLLGGKAVIDSHPGCGTRISVHLPLGRV